MKRLHKDQRGLTIIELLVVIVLTGIITAAITTTFFQVFDMNTRTANHMAALSQVQQAGKLVSEDMLEAQNVDAEDDLDTPELELVTFWATDNTYKVIYKLEDTSGPTILWREYYVNLALNSTTKVAEYIDPDPDQTSFTPEGDAFIFKVTATVGKESEQRLYRVQPRPGS